MGQAFSLIVNHDQISNTQLEGRHLQTFFSRLEAREMENSSKHVTNLYEANEA